MIEKVRAKNLKLGLRHIAERAYQASPYPFVKKFWPGFRDLNPGMQQGLITTELSAEFAMMTLACYGSVAIATQQPTTSEGPSTLGPKITKENFNTEVKTGQINSYLGQTSKKFLGEFGPYSDIYSGNLDTFEFMSTVKVDESGKVTTDKFSFDFNDQIPGTDGAVKDYLVHNSFVSIKDKDGGSGLYLYTQLVDEEGKIGSYGFVDAEGKQHVVPNLNKVVTFPDESNPKNAIVYTNVDGYLYPLLQVENAYDEAGVYVGGKIVGFNHVTGERNEPIIDNLVGVVGIANLTADTEGNLISAVGTFGDPTISPPPTPEFINIRYVSSTENNKPAIAITPTNEAPMTEVPVEAIKLDKPMTVEFDMTNVDAMPSTDEGMVRSGQLNEAVKQYWQETGIINLDGSINKPENVVAAKPSEWKIITRTGDASQNVPGGDQTLAPYTEAGTYRLMKDFALQPTDLLFKVKDVSGNITGILATEILYYEDANGKVNVEPVFFFVDVSKSLEVNMPLFFGHGSFDGPTGDTISVTLYVGVKDGEAGQATYLSRFIADKSAYLSEPMQDDREAFAQQVDATGNPEGMGNFWWAENLTATEYKPK